MSEVMCAICNRVIESDDMTQRTRIRVYDIELNHMLHRLCGPPSIPLSFTLAGVLPRWIT